MGFRTVVVLSNDQAHEWEKDPELGRKIMHAGSMKMCGYPDRARSELPYGTVVEQVHADTQTLVRCDGYSGEAIAYGHWHRGQSDEQRDLALLKALADKLGYRVVRKSKVKA